MPGDSCIECSRVFPESHEIGRPTYKLPTGVGVCDRCYAAGPGKGTERRDWSTVDDEELEYGDNAADIAADRMAVGIASLNLEKKTQWWDEHDSSWYAYIHLRGWQNTLNGKVKCGITGTSVVYHSESQKKKMTGWISDIDGTAITISRDPTKKEIDKLKAAGKYHPDMMYKRKLKLVDLLPPCIDCSGKAFCGMSKKCQGCGLAHTDTTLGSERGWGMNPKYGGDNVFCASCIPPAAIPLEAGDHEHIGFCKSEFCGCWTCSSSDFNDDVEHMCRECRNMSSSGWVDRKSGLDWWFCRGCWIEYYNDHKLVRLCDVDESSKEDTKGLKGLKGLCLKEAMEPNSFDGIWVSRSETTTQEQIDNVKYYQKRNYQLEPHMVNDLSWSGEGDVPYKKRLEAQLLSQEAVGKILKPNIQNESVNRQSDGDYLEIYPGGDMCLVTRRNYPSEIK